MNNDNKTTRELALEWWNKLPFLEREDLERRYFHSSTEDIYLMEHPTETESKEQDGFMDMGFLDVPVGYKEDFGKETEEPEVDLFNSLDIDFISKRLRVSNCSTQVEDMIISFLKNIPRLAKENKELKEENKLVREALEIIITSPEWIKNYGGGAVDKKAKSALNQ